MPKPELKLRSLAQQKFGNLSVAESRVIDGCVRGEAADCRGPDLEADGATPDAADFGGPCAVRASFLRWLCTDERASSFVTPRGLVIENAIVRGHLALDNCTIRFPLKFRDCVIVDGVSLSGSRLRCVALQGCTTTRFDADGATFDSDLLLHRGYLCTAGTDLSRARVAGILGCAAASFEGRGAAPALDADGIEVRGDVFLDNGFKSSGEVRFLGAKVGGQFNCRNGEFTHPAAENDADAKALNADGIEVRSGVFLNGGFKSSGEVRFLGAKVGGTFDCNDGKFTHPAAENDANAKALNADGIDVRGGVFLDNGFKSSGEVRFLGAKVVGQFGCRNGEFTHPAAENDTNAKALNADGIDVRGGVFLNGGFKSSGEVRFPGAKVGGTFACQGGEFTHPAAANNKDASALSADRIDVRGSVFLNNKFRSSGEVRFLGAKIGGQFACRGGEFVHPIARISYKAAALNAENIEIGGTAFLDMGFHAKGRVVLDGARLKSGLVCRGQPGCPSGWARSNSAAPAFRVLSPWSNVNCREGWTCDLRPSRP